MNAKKLVGVVGNRLVGRTVWTEAMGYYPGGAARVVELAPDSEAQEILFTVEHPTWEHSGSSRMGVFEWEEVVLL
jgi:hypothetical protein